MVLHGFDVASYQADMNVGKVPGDFVLVKATEGTNYINPEFSKHVKQTVASNKKLGIYHFIRNDSSVKKQADYYLTTIKKYIGEAMLVLDFENTKGSSIQNQNGVRLAKQWLDYIYKKTGVRAVLYTGLSCENTLDWSSVVKSNYGLWIAQYNNYKPVTGYTPRDLYGSLKNWETAVMFQYTSNGYLTGWTSGLDLDVFYGDTSTWDKYAKATKTVTESKPVPKPKPTATGPKWVKETKTYTLKTAVKLRKSASTAAGVITVLPAGSTVKTDRAIIQGGYRWVRQPRSGGYGYLATGPKSNTLAYVKSGVAKTYYKVKSGDSWWAIANSNGMTVGKLTKLNGATASTMIHPGDKIRIK
ncbi:GH25 family lysozyme [Lactiplantibacillus plajomi]|uniref:GH25 family lysozyme n=1 Tax=Lactiplantibacillus plajomi TaxID=1457217 RepID=A0ABV6K0W0_9LACO|nr:GH25 family lysozyme [Lactiplantibacillus plajomi]